jgi:hypothetical protein
MGTRENNEGGVLIAQTAVLEPKKGRREERGIRKRGGRRRQL